MNRLLCLTLVLVSMATIASAFVSGPCPIIGCADSTCSMITGCNNCQTGWCKMSDSNGPMTKCVPNCGENKFCYSPGSYCTACLVDNCSRCSERYKCDECKRGYELKPSVVRDSCERPLNG